MNQEEIIRISSNLILVDALVLDKKGQQVTNLTAGDFDIFQDGKPQTIINFGYISPGSAAVRETETSKTRNDKNSVPLPPISVRSNQGRVITFVIDDGNCLATVEGLEVARDAMKKFIDLQMLPDDKVAIYRTRGGTSLLQLYTSNKEALKRVVNKVNWLPSACGSAFDPARSDTTFSRQSTLGNYGKETFESKEDKEFREARENYERDNQIIVCRSFPQAPFAATA